MNTSTPTYLSSSRSADITQFMIISSLIMLIGVTLPARGASSLLSFSFNKLTYSSLHLMFSVIPVIVAIGVLSSIAAFFVRHRALGLPSIMSSLYVLLIGDRYVRMYAWGQPVQIGDYAIFAGTIFLIGASIIYMFRPGIRPAQISFFGTAVRWQQLRILAFLCYIGAVVAYQQQLPQVGSWCVIVGMGFSLAARLLRFRQA